MRKPSITEAQAEAMADRMVWNRLQTCAAYRNAASSEEQSEVEERVARAVWETIEERYEVAA